MGAIAKGDGRLTDPIFMPLQSPAGILSEWQHCP
jgi:hypothetical protein